MTTIVNAVINFCSDFSGYLIPKGWKVLPLFRNIHHSPENFPEPHKFDPSRFEVILLSVANSFSVCCHFLGSSSITIGKSKMVNL